ncbi:MAG: CBS domain-containing protein [Burkholderiales bacterium]|nr:CBS domain-containing protein [Burkholderiales bacterium]
MKSVEELLRNKSPRPLVKVTPDVSVYEAVRLMAEYNVGALIVCDADGKMVGMITERDYARKIVLQGRSSRSTMVRDIMSEKVIFVTPAQDIEHCMILMTQKRIRHLPVVENNEVQGLLSIGDLVHATISEKEYIIHQLEHYIHG